VIDCLIAIGVKSVATVTPPVGVKEGWDAADAFEEDWTTERVAELIAMPCRRHQTRQTVQKGSPTPT
jgi:hypothetical protein